MNDNEGTKCTKKYPNVNKTLYEIVFTCIYIHMNEIDQQIYNIACVLISILTFEGQSDSRCLLRGTVFSLRSTNLAKYLNWY